MINVLNGPTPFSSRYLIGFQTSKSEWREVPIHTESLTRGDGGKQAFLTAGAGGMRRGAANVVHATPAARGWTHRHVLTFSLACVQMCPSPQVGRCLDLCGQVRGPRREHPSVAASTPGIQISAPTTPFRPKEPRRPREMAPSRPERGTNTMSPEELGGHKTGNAGNPYAKGACQRHTGAN